MIYFFAAGTAFGMIFPTFFKIRIAIDGKSKRIFYSVRSFFGLPVNSGYLSFDRKYLFFHFSDKRAIALSYGKLRPGKNGVNPFRHIEFLSFRSISVFGETERPSKLTAALIWLFGSRFLSSLSLSVKDFLRLRGNDIYLSDGEGDVFFLEADLLFNAVSVIEIITESIIGRFKKNA